MSHLEGRGGGSAKQKKIVQVRQKERLEGGGETR